MAVDLLAAAAALLELKESGLTLLDGGGRISSPVD